MSEKSGTWFRILVYATIGLGAAALTVFLLHQEIRKLTMIDPAILNAIGFGSCLLIVSLWWTWFVFGSQFSRFSSWVGGALGVILPAAFFLFFQPKFGGDLAWKGLEYRFARSSAPAEGFETPVLCPLETDASSPGAFPGFLGPDRNGVVPDVRWRPAADRSPPELVWKRRVGEGWSAAAIAGEAVVTMEQRDDREMVTCYRLSDGKPVWEYSHLARYEDPTAMGRFGPRATPQIHAGKVFAQGGTGILMALDAADGRLLWSVDVCERLGIKLKARKNLNGLAVSQEASRLNWGRSTSPLVYGDTLIVAGGIGNDDPSAGATLMALDQATGTLLWKSGSAMIAYGSPSLAKVAGREQVLLMAEKKAMGFDPVTGEVLWEYDRKGNSNSDANCSQITVIDENRLLLSKGYSLGGEMIRIESRDGKMVARRDWANSRVLRTKFTNPVLFREHLFSLSDGFLECVDLKGKSVWKQRGAYENGQLLLLGDQLVIQSEDGELFIIPATIEQPEAATPTPTVKGLCWNNLAYSNGLLVVRSDLEMACFRLDVLPRSETADSDGARGKAGSESGRQ